MPTTFANTINGNPIYAARAVADKDGNQIDTTYAKLADIPPGVTVDQTYDSSSTNAQSGTAVAGALATVNQVPASTSADEDKVLTVDSNGDPVWAASQGAPQVQADWDETDTSDPSYIQNKPTIPAAQVNADWTASSGVAEILHKPTIPSATSDLTNDSGFITSSDVPSAQEQADWNESDSSDPAYIKNKPTIPAAQVNADWTATSGVAEILHKPTIPSATSDLTNDSGFITSSDVPGAQEQADWNESDSSDPAFIKNKPTIPSAVTVDQTYNSSSTNPQSGTAVAGAIAGVNQVPASTSADEDKVLTVNSSGNPVWATPQGGGGTVDQTYNASSTNAQSGTAVAGALATVSQVPSTTGASSGDVLVVDGHGDPAWAAPQSASQVQSDWTETDTTDPAYIQNKPTQKSLVAGGGIAISESNGTVTISEANPVPASTVQDENKVLSVDSTGAPVWSSSFPLSSDVHAIALVNSLPASPVSGTLYLIPET